MGYIDSYLAQVGRHLPVSQRDDILSELRASIEEQVLDIADERGPTVDDEKAVLGRLGHPLNVASGFNGPRYLIGPELFPGFIQTLKTVLVIVALVQLGVILTAFVTVGYTTSLVGLFSGVFDTLLWATVVVVTVFAVIEYSGDQLNWYEGWTPDSLRIAPAAQVKRGDLLTNLVSEGVFLLWWNDVLRFQNWLPVTGDSFTVTLAPVWDMLYWPLNVLFGAWFVLHAVVLLRGVWYSSTLWFEITLGTIGIAICAWLFANSPLVSLSGALSENAEVIVQRSLLTIIVGIAVVTAWDIWLAIKRLRESRML